MAVGIFCDGCDKHINEDEFFIQIHRGDHREECCWDCRGRVLGPLKPADPAPQDTKQVDPTPDTLTMVEWLAVREWSVYGSLGRWWAEHRRAGHLCFRPDIDFATAVRKTYEDVKAAEEKEPT